MIAQWKCHFVFTIHSDTFMKVRNYFALWHCWTTHAISLGFQITNTLLTYELRPIFGNFASEIFASRTTNRHK